MAQQQVTIVLDWTPNTNHVGFYVAQEQGLFKKAGLDVKLLPATDPAVLKHGTPARMVTSGEAQFAVAPSETSLSFWTNGKNPSQRLRAVAALLQVATSSIAATRASGISSPRMLAGKKYASYGGRFEDHIVRAMVEADGGKGSEVNFVPLPQHGYSDEGVQTAGFLKMLESGECDATWIFSHWEGLMAKRQGAELFEFPPVAHGVPYGYSPTLVADPTWLTEPEKVEAGARLMRAVADGYLFAAANPDAAAELLARGAQHPACADVDFLKASMAVLAPAILGDSKEWGVMQDKRWADFVDFCFGTGAVTDRDGAPLDRASVNVKDLFTNELLEKSKAL